MTDRELLELAAKAAGHDFFYVGDQICCIWERVDGRAVRYGPWTPLADDAAAFRLMVKLGISKTLDLELGPGGALVTIHHPEVYADEFNVPTQPEFDAVAATRRAIVRAAAEIARAQAA